MRRRRQKNTLLPKMIGIAVLVNAVLLPILAQMGVFKTVEQHLQPVQLVNLPPPEKKPPPTPPKKIPPKKTTKTHPRPQAKVAARQTNSHPSRPNPNQPHVVAAAPSGSGSGDNTIDNSGTGTAGQVPTEPLPSLTTPPPVASSPAPTPPAPEPPPSPPPVPVVVAAHILSEPRPEVPDDLRDNELHTVFRGVFTIHADGTASLRMTQSTGNDELDKLATDCARRWTFQPATQDGTPVDSYYRLEMRFDVGA